MIGRTIAHYRVLQLLGRGGMGEVYLAQDTTLPRKVALKLLPEDKQQDAASRTRLLREAESAATINHPFICSIHEIGEFEGTDFIAMEYVEGESLKERLDKGPFPVPKALPIASEIAEALEKAQAKGIVHRDLKPANIMLTTEGHPKILDFGLAKRVTPVEGVESEDQTITNLTQQGSTVGTLAYMSPEQVRGQPADARSDIFSFGIVLYEMLAGVHPFQRPHAMETASAILRDEPAPLARHVKGAPELLEHVVGKALAKDPEERYQSAGELKTDLRRLISGHTAVPKTWRKQTLPRIALACTLAATLAAAVVFWPSQKDVVPEGNLAVEGETISLVAIPAQVFGPAEEMWLTDAIPRTLTDLLPRNEWLKPKVPPTSLQVERVEGDFSRIGTAYGVKFCLIPSVRIESNQMVLSLQLADPVTRDVLWSHSYKGKKGSYSEILKQAALGILQALRPSASPEIQQAALASSSEAERAFRRAEYYSNRFNNGHQPEDFETSLRAYQRALELDPDLEEAAAGMAFLHLFQIETGVPAEEALLELVSWANRALELNRDCARAWGALGAAEELHSTSSWRKRLQYFLKSVQLDPQDELAHLGLSRNLPPTMELESLRESARLNPFYLYAGMGESNSLRDLRRMSEAISVIDRVLGLEPDLAYALGAKTNLLIASGSLEEGRQLLERVRELAEQDRYPKLLFQGLELAWAARQHDPSLTTLFPNLVEVLSSPQLPAAMVWYVEQPLFFILTEQGYTSEITKLMSLSASRGFVPGYYKLATSPHLESLRKVSGFNEIWTRSQAEFVEKMGILEEARSRGELPDYLTESFEEVLQLRRDLPSF